MQPLAHASHRGFALTCLPAWDAVARGFFVSGLAVLLRRLNHDPGHSETGRMKLKPGARRIVQRELDPEAGVSGQQVPRLSLGHPMLRWPGSVTASET